MDAFRCGNCDYESITFKYYCPTCSHAGGLQKFSTVDEGEVYSYTTIHVAPPQFADEAPYQVVLVQLTDKLKVTGWMKEKVEIGDRVKLKELKDGRYVFEPVEVLGRI